MDPEARQAAILRTARDRGRVEVASMASQLGVAAETVRRDLRALVDRGVLRRVHGGAIAVETAGFESDVAYRSRAHLAQKRRIAGAARQLLHGAETVYLDEGVTPRLIAEELHDAGPLVVVTPSPPAAQALASVPGMTVFLLGGRLRGRTLGTVDHWTVRMLGELAIDVAFLGANGVSRQHGVTTPDPAVAAVKQEALRRSRRHVLVGAHVKFGVSSFHRFAELGDFEAIVTGTELPAYEALRFEALGPHVIRA